MSMWTDSANTASSKDLEQSRLGWHALERWPVLRYYLWATMILCWFVDALSTRQLSSPDAISYLDIASACMKGQWGRAVNAYWSPAYPVLLSFWFSIFHPSVFTELLAAKCFNCLALIFAMFCFEYFLRGLLEYAQEAATNDRQGGPLPVWSLRTTGYTLFFWMSLYLIPPTLVTPDTLVLASILFAAGIIVRMAAGADSWSHFAALGIVLGFGYLAKAVMFPMALIFLACSPFTIGNLRRTIPRVLLALALFSLVSLPFVVLISRSKGRFTFGDTGGIAYAEYVNGVNFTIHWQGKPPGTGTPKHPTRKILDTPLVYEYASPVAGTYPPWSDPSYWYDGVHPHFELGGQLNVLCHSFDSYFELSTQLGSFIAGFAALVLSQNRIRDSLKRFWSVGFLWIPALAGLAMYALILVEARYIVGFLLLLWAGVFLAIRAPRNESGSAIVRCVTLAAALLFAFQIVWSVGHSVVRLASFRPPADLEVADELSHEGIVPGDKVAFVGFALMDHYWAFLAKVSIVAEVYHDDVESFWEARPEQKAQVLNLFAKSGAKAVIARDVPSTRVADGWRQVAGTSYFILMLPSP